MKEESPQVYILDGLPVPAALWARAVAFILDCLLGGVLLGIILNNFVIPHWWSKEFLAIQDFIRQVALLKNAAEHPVLPPQALSFLHFSQVFILIGLWAFFTLNERLSGGASLGKRVLGLRVVRRDLMDPPSFLETLLRACIKALCLFAGLPILLDALYVFINANRQAGHDWFARTIVVYWPELEKLPTKEKAEDNEGDDLS